MVSNNRRRLKKPCDPQALLSFFCWIKILCSGCFGTIVHFKRAWNNNTEGRMRTTGREAGRLAVSGKLDLPMGNLTLQRQQQQREMEAFAWELPSGGANDDEGEESEMFEGRFYVGSRVLTEVEMRSPVEESKGVATIVKAHRNSSPSSVQPAGTAAVHPATDSAELPAIASQTSSSIQGKSEFQAGSKPIDIATSSPISKAAAESPEKMPSGVGDGERDQTPSTAAAMPECGKAKNLARKGSRGRQRSVTDHDFAELRGCIDLGFVFTQDDIPDLCGTLPALEVCYAITQKLQDPLSPSSSTCEDSRSASPGSLSASPVSSWRIASPGDQPQQVKTRLRHWAQAVACTVRQSC